MELDLLLKMYNVWVVFIVCQVKGDEGCMWIILYIISSLWNRFGCICKVVF